LIAKTDKHVIYSFAERF